MSPYSVHGKILEINLTDQKIRVSEFPTTEFLANYVGSRGIQARLYWDLVKPETKPLSDENIVLIGSGTFTGSPLPSAGRIVATFKSPLTGMYFKGSAGGDFGLKLKQNGYDIIMIKGSSEEPVYIYIKDDHVDILPAKELWGLDIREAHVKLLKKYGIHIDTLLIGPAGEKLVKYASINTSVYNLLARGGGGAVLGYKKLKGVVVSKGTRRIQLYDPKRFLKLSIKVFNNIMKDEALINTSKYGSASATMGLNGVSALPNFNFRKPYWEYAFRNSGEYYVEAGYLVGRVSCGQCVVGCHRHTKTEKYGGVETVGPEYETSNALGGNIGVSDTDALIKMNDLANTYGIDTISLGSVIAWVMESYEKGYLKELRDELNTEPTWGNAEAAIKLIKAIAARKGIGNLLAEGTAVACKKTDPETCKWAVQARGLEHSRVETRIARAYALAFALNPRGPDHLHTETFAEFGFTEEAKKLIERITGDRGLARVGINEGRPKIVAWHEDMYAVTDSVGLCAFITTAGYAIDEYLMSELFEAATGISETAKELMRSGERIITLERMIQVREGRRRKDDTLPWRILHESVVTKEGKKCALTEEELNEMLDEYFELRNWDKIIGVPLPDKLRKLNLSFTVPLAEEVIEKERASGELKNT